MIKEIKLSEKLDKGELRAIKGSGGCGCGPVGSKCGTHEVSQLIFDNSSECSGTVQEI